ncbi:hypothetical protein Q8A73_018300 [Channa argus]|nr:hypothetical protein Q8A73_018300 [Channa argus]
MYALTMRAALNESGTYGNHGGCPSTRASTGYLAKSLNFEVLLCNMVQEKTAVITTRGLVHFLRQRHLPDKSNKASSRKEEGDRGLERVGTAVKTIDAEDERRVRDQKVKMETQIVSEKVRAR